MPQLIRVGKTPASFALPDRIPLERGSTLTFGRSKEASVHLDSTIVPNMISRSHAKILVDGETGIITLIDTNSTNGVYVNDRKVDVRQLRMGDRITFGGRGRAVAIGTIDPQPQSEFIYELQYAPNEQMSNNTAVTAAATADDEDDDSQSALAFLKTLTEHVQLIGSWLTAATVVATYLFAPEDSKEHSFVQEHIAPIFAFLHIPFTRTTFTLSFVFAVGLLFAAALAIFKRTQSSKRKRKSKAVSTANHGRNGSTVTGDVNNGINEATPSRAVHRRTRSSAGKAK